MARGNRREAIFQDEEDRRFFLKCLAEACERTGWQVHAWVLMSNHYHLFIETPEANLVEGMKWLQNTVTRRYNVRHGKWGRLFGDRYKSIVVEGKEPGYYAALWDYIHLNPARAGLIKVKKGESVLDYPWSSIAGGYALMPRRRAKWLAAAQGLSTVGFADTVAGRKEMVAYLDGRAREEGETCGIVGVTEGADGRRSHLRRGWYWGRQAFAEWALKKAEAGLLKPKSRAYQRSPERLAHGLAEAGKLLEEGLKKAGLKKSDLQDLPATDPRKVEIARQIWRKTTVSQAWLAEHLQMRSAANVSLILHRAKTQQKAVPRALRKFVEMKEHAH